MCLFLVQKHHNLENLYTPNILGRKNFSNYSVNFTMNLEENPKVCFYLSIVYLSFLFQFSFLNNCLPLFSFCVRYVKHVLLFQMTCQEEEKYFLTFFIIKQHSTKRLFLLEFIFKIDCALKWDIILLDSKLAKAEIIFST